MSQWRRQARIQKVRNQAQKDQVFDAAGMHLHTPNGEAVLIDYNDDLVGYLVDEEDDEDYERSKSYHDATHLEHMKADLPVIE